MQDADAPRRKQTTKVDGRVHVAIMLTSPDACSKVQGKAKAARHMMSNHGVRDPSTPISAPKACLFSNIISKNGGQ